METGTKISLVAHGTFLTVALLGAPFFDSDDSSAIRISEVSMISSAEFEALKSRSPATVLELPEQVLPIQQTEETAVAPRAETPPDTAEQPIVEAPTAPDALPDLTALKVPEQPELIVQSPNLEDQANTSVGTTFAVPDSPVANEDSSGQRQPDQLAMVIPQLRPAPRVDTTIADKPATDATPAPETSQSTTPDVTATEQAEEALETAPLESTTEIVTEPEADLSVVAPVKSSRPQGRPTDLAAKAKKAKDEAAKLVAVASAKAQKEADAKAIEAALLAVTTETQPVQPTGPPLTSSERDGLVLAVQQCWNVPVGLQNASELVVVLAVELTLEGRLTGNPILIEPTGTLQATTQRAFEAGRRALIRCAPYDLPSEKYEQWRQLEVVFNPKKMVVK